MGQGFVPCFPVVIFSFKAFTLDSSTEGPWSCSLHVLGGLGGTRLDAPSSWGQSDGLRRGPLSGCSAPSPATAGVTCLGFVLLPDLDALQGKREAETLNLDGPSNLLGLHSALIWTPAQMAYLKKRRCPLYNNVDTHWKGQVTGQYKQVTSKLIFSRHEECSFECGEGTGEGGYCSVGSKPAGENNTCFSMPIFRVSKTRPQTIQCKM